MAVLALTAHPRRLYTFNVRLSRLIPMFFWWFIHSCPTRRGSFLDIGETRNYCWRVGLRPGGGKRMGGYVDKVLNSDPSPLGCIIM